MIGQDVWLAWRMALKGEALPIDQQLPTGHGGVDGHPQPGLYRRKEGGGWQDGKRQPHTWVPVRIFLTDDDGQTAHKWQDGLKINAVQGRDTVVDPLKIWSWCQTRDATGKIAVPDAIKQDIYKHWIEHGRWPDDAPAPTEHQPEPDDRAAPPPPTPDSGSAPAGLGHNRAEDDEGFDALVRIIQQNDAATQEWLKTLPEGRSAGDKASNWLTDIRGLKNKYEALYDSEKAPIQDALNAFEAKWGPYRRIVEATRRRLADAVTLIGDKERKRLQAIADADARKKAEAIRAQLEAERAAKMEAKRKAREEAAAQAGMLPLDPPPPEPEPEPIVVHVQAEPVKVQFGGSTGRKVGLKTVKKAVITDWQAAAAHYAMSPRVQEIVQKLADADAKNGVACPGSSINDTVAAA